MKLLSKIFLFNCLLTPALLIKGCDINEDAATDYLTNKGYSDIQFKGSAYGYYLSCPFRSIVSATNENGQNENIVVCEDKPNPQYRVYGKDFI